MIRGYESGYESGVWCAQIELPVFTKNCTRLKKTQPYIYIYVCVYIIIIIILYFIHRNTQLVTMFSVSLLSKSNLNLHDFCKSLSTPPSHCDTCYQHFPRENMRLAKCSNAWAQCTLGRGKFGARVNNTIPWYVIVSWRSNAARLKHIRKNLPPWKLRM